MSVITCAQCKQENVIWEGYRCYTNTETFITRDGSFFCPQCVDSGRRKPSENQRFVSAIAELDVKIVRRGSGLIFVSVNCPERVVALVERPESAIPEYKFSDQEYGSWLSEEEKQCVPNESAVREGGETEQEHVYEANEAASRSWLALFFGVKAQGISVLDSRAFVGATATALEEGFQAIGSGTPQECWAVVSALRDAIYSLDSSNTEDSGEGGADAESTEGDGINVSPLILRRSVHENALYWGVVLHTFFHKHEQAVERLLRVADGEHAEEHGVPSAEEVVTALSGLLVSCAQLMVIASQRQLYRCIINQDAFWEQFMSDAAMDAKYSALEQLREAWSENEDLRRGQSLRNYVDGCKQYLGVFHSAMWKKQDAFDKSFDGAGRCRPIRATAAPGAALSAVLDSDALGNYMESLRMAKNHIFYQPLFYANNGGTPCSPKQVYLRGELWARVGCHQLLEVINRCLFHSPTPNEASSDLPAQFASSSGWRLMASTIKQFCISPLYYSQDSVNVGEILESVVEESEAQASKELQLNINFDLNRNLQRDAVVSHKLFELLRKRGEDYLRSDAYNACAAVKEVPFHLTNYLCGKTSRAAAVDEEVLRPCCEMHQEMRGMDVSPDFLSCSRCLLKTLFPDTPEAELRQLGELGYHTLNLELKSQLRRVVSVLTDKLFAVEGHIQYVLDLVFDVSGADEYRRLADSYLAVNVLPQSLPVIKPYVDKMYSKMSQAPSSVEVASLPDGTYAFLIRRLHLRVSDVLAMVRARAEDIRYIVMHADIQLDVDCDVRLPGVSVLLRAMRIRLGASHTIDVSGRDATERGANGAKGADGTRREKKGEDGAMGFSGQPGGDGGNIALHHEMPLVAVAPGGGEFVLTLRSRGGNGSAGGDGGNGGGGYSAPEKEDATVDMFRGDKICGGYYSQYSIEPLMNTETPGKAGKGGGVGSGGIGGRRGEITAAPSKVAAGARIHIASDCVNGNSGVAGRPGLPGNPGSGGSDGMGLLLTYAYHRWSSPERIEHFPYYALRDGRSYYDGVYCVRGREEGSTGTFTRLLRGGRTMHCNYTWGRYFTKIGSFIRPHSLGARQFVCGGVVCNRADFENVGSKATSNPVEQREQRLSFKELQQQLSGQVSDHLLSEVLADVGRVTHIDSAALGAAATMVRDQVSLLDNLLSMTVGEAIVAMERSATFEEALRGIEQKKAQVKTQLLREWKGHAKGNDEDGEHMDDDDDDDTAAEVKRAGKGIMVLELNAAGPLYRFTTSINALNVGVLGVRSGMKTLSAYLTELFRVVSAIQRECKTNAFVWTYLESFVDKSLFQLEAELFRVDAAQLLALALPARDKPQHLPVQLTDCVLRALSYRYTMSIATQLAVQADRGVQERSVPMTRGPQAPKAPTKGPSAPRPPPRAPPARAPLAADGVPDAPPPRAPQLRGPPAREEPAKRNSTLGKVRLCAERLRYCAPTQIPRVLKDADVDVAVCPLFDLCDVPDFARGWRSVIELGKLMFLHSHDAYLQEQISGTYTAAQREFQQWATRARGDSSGLRFFAHTVTRRVYDWLCSFSCVVGAQAALEAAFSTTLLSLTERPEARNGYFALFVLDAWKDVVPAAQFVRQLLRVAERVLPDEADTPKLPSEMVVDALSRLLAFASDKGLLQPDGSQCGRLLIEYGSSRKFFVRKVVLLLKLHDIEARVQKACEPGNGMGLTSECFCTYAIRENWTLSDVMDKTKGKREGDYVFPPWTTPCWNCLPHFRKLVEGAQSVSYRSNNSNTWKVERAIKDANAVSLAIFLSKTVGHVIDAIKAGWSQIVPGSDAACFAEWMSGLYDRTYTVGFRDSDDDEESTIMPDSIWTQSKHTPPSLSVLVSVQNATRWTHAPFTFDVEAMKACSCFPVRKHAATRLMEAVSGPYATRIRGLLTKVAPLLTDDELDHLALPLLSVKDMESVLRTLSRAFLARTATRAFGNTDYAAQLRLPILSLCRYACVEAVLIVVGAFEQEFSGGKRTTQSYPEYLSSALVALEGLHLTEGVAAALVGLEMSCWMCALQKRRFFQCVGQWWTARHIDFPAHEMYNWLLHLGENNFDNFMTMTRSLDDATVRRVLQPFLAVPSTQRGALGKLNDALSASGMTASRIAAYQTAWSTKRSQVAIAIQQLDRHSLAVRAKEWERSWDDIRSFLKEERVEISDEVIALCVRIHSTFGAAAAGSRLAMEDDIARFRARFAQNWSDAQSNDGMRRVRSQDRSIWSDESVAASILVSIFIGFYMTKGIAPRCVQVVAVVALLQGSSLANINTSEGKTYITGCVLAFKLFCGYRVAFATSSFDLAKEAASFNAEAFTLLFGTAVRATAEDAETAKSNDHVYRAHMVYTTEGNISARILRTLLDPTDERAFREWRGYAHWLVLDEADVPMVQSLTESMYVGGLSLDARLDALAFPSLMACGRSGNSEQAPLSVWMQRVGSMYLTERDRAAAQRRFARYWESAKNVWGVSNDEEYVAVNNKSVPYNTETGETLYSSSWKDGLSTMVCMKEQQRWEWETEASLTVNPLLVLSTFFKKRLTAVTGTAGGFATQAIYAHVYGLKPVVIPPAFFSLFEELPPELYSNEKAYYDGIERSTRRAIANSQDVLVAVETVAEADRLLEYVRAEFRRRPAAGCEVRCQRYARERMDRMPVLEAGVRHVFFMTFLGGRGLDVRPSAGQPNGIHVVLCCAQHERATHQVLRRAARQYHPGSGQIICLQSGREADAASFATNLLSREAFFQHQNKAIEAERRRLQMLVTKEIPQALLRQELQEKVQDCVRALRAKEGHYLHASCLVQHCFSEWLSQHDGAITAKGEDAACRQQLLTSLDNNVLHRFESATLGDVQALARFARSSSERVLLTQMLRGSNADLPWCSAAVFQLFANVAHGSCAYGVPELVHALSASASENVVTLRRHVRAFSDVLSRWATALENFAADLHALHREAGDGDNGLEDEDGEGEGGRATDAVSGDLPFVNAACVYIGRLRDHYLSLIGTDGVVMISMFEGNSISITDSVKVLERLVAHGLVVDPACTAKEAGWQQTCALIKEAVPALATKTIPLPRTSLGMVQFCSGEEGVTAAEIDALFQGDAPLLAPLRISAKLFHEHNQTYAEELSKCSILYLKQTLGILVSCAGLLRKDQVRAMPTVSAFAKFKNEVDEETIFDWACLGYHHVVDVEERPNSTKNQARIDEEERKKAEANSFWGRVCSVGAVVGKALLDIGLNYVLNAVVPGAGLFFKCCVVPFIKSGVNTAKRWIETGKLEVKQFFKDGIAGAVMNCAATGMRRVGNYLKDTLGSTAIGARIAGAYNSAKEKIGTIIYKAKSFFTNLADRVGLNNAFTRAVSRYSCAYMLRRGKNVVIRKVTKMCVTDFRTSTDAIVAKKLKAPLLELLVTVRAQKPDQYRAFMSQLVPHISRGSEDVSIVDFAIKASSTTQTVDQMLRVSCRTSNDETAAIMCGFADTLAFAQTVCSGPQGSVTSACDEYVSKSWSYAAREFGVDRSRAESAVGVQADGQQSFVIAQLESLVYARVVNPLRNVVNGVADGCVSAIRGAVDYAEFQEHLRQEKERRLQQLLAQQSGGATLQDSTRFAAHSSLLSNGPSNGVALPSTMQSDFDTPLASATTQYNMLASSAGVKGRGNLDRLIDAGEAAVEFFQSDKGKLALLAALALSTEDAELIDQIMRMVSGDSFTPPVVLSRKPTLVETFLILGMILYQRFNVHRRLESTTFKDAILEIVVATVCAMANAGRVFDRERRELQMGYGPFVPLKTLFQRAVEYSSRAYEKDKWRGAEMAVEGHGVGSPTFQIYLDRDSELVVLAFRGTTTGLDMLTDAVCAPVMFCGESAHRGFASAVDTFFKNAKAVGRFRQLAEMHASYRILITGHSLGGSLAILTGLKLIYEMMLSAEMQRRLYVVGIAAAPATSHRFAMRDQFFNVVNHLDVVPRVQLNSLDRLLQELFSDCDAEIETAIELVQPENTFLYDDGVGMKKASTTVVSTIYCARRMVSDHFCSKYLTALDTADMC